jgi:hypothetical protein
MINYITLKQFLRVTRVSIELAGEINSSQIIKQDSGDYSHGLSAKQQKILKHVQDMEKQLEKPTMANIKRSIYKLERLTGSKIPQNIFSLEPIKNN